MKPMKTTLIILALVAVVVGKKRKEEDILNVDNTPFWLQDVLVDGMCLGPDGFGPCDATNLWTVAQTHPTKKTKVIVSLYAPETDKMCLGSKSRGMFSPLRRVGVSKCSGKDAKNLNFGDLKSGDPSDVLLMQGKNCLARGEGRLRNSADMQPCHKGTPLAIMEAPVNIAGMQIITADGYCFDGSRFRVCNDGDPTMRWSLGFDFRSKEPSRNLLFFFDREKCAVREGERAKKGDCNSKGAANWGWRDGRLTQGKKHCLGRASDDSAIMVPCSEGYEHVAFLTPGLTVPGIPNQHVFGSLGMASTPRGTTSRRHEA